MSALDRRWARRWLGREREAALAYEAALGLTDNAAERQFLRRRLASVSG